MYKMQVSFGQPVRVLSAQPGCQQSFQSTNPWGFHSPSPLQPPQASPQDTCVQALAEQHSRFGAVPVPAVLPRGLPSLGSPERADASVGARPWQTCCSSQHCLCEHLQVLGRVLLCYTSFLCGLPTFYTVHTHVQRTSLWQFAAAITLLQTTCFQVNVSSLYQQQGLIFLYKHIKGLICALTITQI